MKLLVCIPTYNETENIEDITENTFSLLPSNGEILVIDDGSPDGTAEIVEKLISVSPFNDRLHILKRNEKQGLGKAYLAAFYWGLDKDYDAFLEMDADFSHNPKYIPIMIKEIANNDVVIGSRNIKGGSVEGWGLLRNIISKGGSLYSRWVLGCPIKDLTGGFNMWTRDSLLTIGLTNIISNGYSFQVEMKYRAFKAGCKIKEIPITFIDRKAGVSKMSKEIFFEAALNVWKIKKNIQGDTSLLQFIKFCITGTLGTFSNLVIFFLLSDLAKLHEIPISAFCFLVAGTQNYLINYKWSFAVTANSQKASVKQWSLFMVSSLFGLAVNISVMLLMINNFNISYKVFAQAAGILCGLLINFVLSKLIVFKGKNHD